MSHRENLRRGLLIARMKTMPRRLEACRWQPNMSEERATGVLDKIEMDSRTRRWRRCCCVDGKEREMVVATMADGDEGGENRKWAGVGRAGLAGGLGLLGWAEWVTCLRLCACPVLAASRPSIT